MLAEGDLLWPLEPHYNSTVNGKTAYPVVADAETYELNRLQLTNTSIADTTLTVGRQRINLDDQRFVGNVGWRQNEQTYDSVRVVNKTIPNLTVDLTYVDQVNRVFGKDSPVGRYNGVELSRERVVSDAGRQAHRVCVPAGFRRGAARFVAKRWALRFTGERPVKKIKVAWLASYARQQERANNPLSFEEDFYTLELTGTFRQYSVGAGLRGDGGRRRAGLHHAARHASQVRRLGGQVSHHAAERPRAALRDAGLPDERRRRARYAVRQRSVYHQFQSDRLGIDYGSEVDLQLQAKWHRFNRPAEVRRLQRRHVCHGHEQVLGGDQLRLVAHVPIR